MELNDIQQQASVLASRPYTYTLIHDVESNTWTSGVLEVAGAISEGDDPNEAIEMAREALELVIAHRLRSEVEVPEPFETREWSGELRLRLTPELHRRAATLAAEEAVSLNRWLSAAVARESGMSARPVADASTGDLRAAFAAFIAQLAAARATVVHAEPPADFSEAEWAGVLKWTLATVAEEPAGYSTDQPSET